jgi:hypothetical protein
VHITRNDEKATWTLIPTTPDEEKTLASVASLLSVGNKIEYHGRTTDPDDENAVSVHFNAGGKHARRTTYGKNGGSSTRSVYVGGVTLVLIGSTPEDKNEIACIRDTCFDQTEVDGKFALLFTAKHCKHCGAPILKMGRCEWSTCDTCVEKCDHEWETGAIHGGGIDLGLGEICGKCGIGKPKADDEPEKSPFAHALAYQEYDPHTLVIHNGVPVRELAAKMQEVGIPLDL